VPLTQVQPHIVQGALFGHPAQHPPTAAPRGFHNLFANRQSTRFNEKQTSLFHNLFANRQTIRYNEKQTSLTSPTSVHNGNLRL
jgi:hypothetical protein